MNKKLKFIIAGVAIVAGLASAVSSQDLSKAVLSHLNYFKGALGILLLLKRMQPGEAL